MSVRTRTDEERIRRALWFRATVLAADGNLGVAAHKLGISRTTLYRALTEDNRRLDAESGHGLAVVIEPAAIRRRMPNSGHTTGSSARDEAYRRVFKVLD